MYQPIQPKDGSTAASGALAFDRSGVAPLPRTTEPADAPIARLAARLDDAQDDGNVAEEAKLSARIARFLATRGTHLSRAIHLAERALLLDEDAALRSDLAAWYAGVGDPRRAAEHFAALAADESDPGRQANARLRAAVLFARAGLPARVRAELFAAREATPDDALVEELVGTIAAWAPDVVSPEEATEIYLSAAIRREAAGDTDAAFEDRLRAFETSRGHAGATATLREALIASNRVRAADFVAYEHALAREPAARRHVHLDRIDAALAHDELGLAILALFDGDLLHRPEPPTDRERVDEVLARAHLSEILVARLLLRTRIATDEEARTAAAHELARSYATLGDETQQLEALVVAGSSSAFGADARRALREAGRASGDFDPLVEAFTRCALDPLGPGPDARRTREEVLRELAHFAEHELSDASLAVFAFERLAEVADAAMDLAHARERLGMAATEQRDEAERLVKTSLQKSPPDGTGRALRVQTLQRLAQVLRSMPDQEARLIDALAAWVSAEPESDRAANALARVVARPRLALANRAHPAAEQALLARIEAPVSRRQRTRARLLLAELRGRVSGSRDPELVAIEFLQLGDRGELDPHGAALLLLFGLAVGRRREMARALEVLAHGHPGPLRSVLFTLASEAFALAKLPVEARRVGLLAVREDPSSPRAHLAVFAAVDGEGSRDARAAAEAIRYLEQALLLSAPTSGRCRVLARKLRDVGEVGLAHAWTQRALALMPSDAGLMTDLVERAISLGAEEVASALSFVLAQPVPLSTVSGAIAAGLNAIAEKDRGRGRSFARRALDVCGPTAPEVRDVIVRMADELHDASLAIMIDERLLAHDGDDVALLLRVVSQRARASDAEGAALALVRAAALPVEPSAIVDALDRVSEIAPASKGGLGGDARLAVAEVHALLAVASGASAGDVAERWRRLGALRWDAAGDVRGAEQALFAAAEATALYALYVDDLRELAGADAAAAAVHGRAKLWNGPAMVRARLFTASARLALDCGAESLALASAVRAVELDPSNTEAIAIAEAATLDPAKQKHIDALYVTIANAAMGIYGRRAAHYRAARILESRGALDLALRHAALSFEAVPTEGTSWTLLRRIAGRVGDPTEAVLTLERVAESSPQAERSGWLKRAADLASLSSDGTELRFDALLRAYVASPESATFVELEAPASQLLASREDAENVAARLARAVRSVLPRLEGPDGAHVAMRTADGLGRLGFPSLAAETMRCALTLDAGHDRYEDCLAAASAIALEPDLASEVAAAALDNPVRGKGAVAFVVKLAEFGQLQELTARAEAELARIVRADEEQRLSDMSWGEDPIGADAAEAPVVEATATPKSDPPLDPDERQRIAHERGDFEEVARILGERAETTRDASERRVFRLRRAALLEQRLGRAEEAADELELLYKESPDDTQIARFLADLHMRAERFDRAASMWERLARHGDDVETRAEHARLAFSAYTRSGQDGAALGMLSLLKPILPEATFNELKLSVAKGARDPLSLLGALDEIANADDGATETERAARWLDAARAAASGGDESGALLRVRRAKKLHPELAEAVVETARLEYKTRGTGTPREAQARVDELLSIEHRLPPGLAELHGFLLAEEIDVIHGGGAGMRELAKRHAALGPLPLLALGMAERLLKLRSFEAALPLFDAALQGDLKGLRGRGRVLLSAADAAIQAGHIARAEAFLEEAESFPDARHLVPRRRQELLAASNDFATASRALEELVLQSSGVTRARYLERLATLSQDHDHEIALALYEEALPLSRLDRALGERIRRKLVELARLMAGQGPEEEAPPSSDVIVIDRLPDEDVAESSDAPPWSRRGRPIPALDAASPVPTDISPDHASAASDASDPIAPEILDPDMGSPPTPQAPEPQPQPPEPPPTATAEADALPGNPASLPAPIVPEVVVAEAETASPPNEPGSDATSLDATSPAPGADVFAEADTEPVGDLVDQAPERPARPPEAPSFTLTFSEGDLGLRPSPVPPAAPVVHDDHVRTPDPRAPNDARHEPDVASDRASRPADRPSPSPDRLSPSPDRPSPLPDRSSQPDRGSSNPGDAARAPRRNWPIIESSREEDLFRALLAGDLESGDALVRVYGEGTHRTRDVLSIRRQQAHLLPGAIAPLTAMREAAIADRDAASARAAEHALDVARGDSVDESFVPVTLEPERVAAILFRDVAAPSLTALTLLLETGALRRSPDAELGRVDRVQPGGSSLLSQIYTSVAPLFGRMRAPLYVGNAAGPFGARVVVVHPTSVVVSGAPPASAIELAHVLGTAFASVAPEFAVARALDEPELRVVFEAVAAAFGPVGAEALSAGRSQDPSVRAKVARLGAELMQRVTPRLQLRLSELAAQPLDAREAREASAVAARRGGLFASGHLGISVRAALREAGVAPPTSSRPGWLQQAAAEHPAVADLVRVWTKVELAEARFSGGFAATPGSRRFTARDRLP